MPSLGKRKGEIFFNPSYWDANRSDFAPWQNSCGERPENKEARGQFADHPELSAKEKRALRDAKYKRKRPKPPVKYKRTTEPLADEL